MWTRNSNLTNKVTYRIEQHDFIAIRKASQIESPLPGYQLKKRKTSVFSNDLWVVQIWQAIGGSKSHTLSVGQSSGRRMHVDEISLLKFITNQQLTIGRKNLENMLQRSH